jgi:hypothetical protein
MIKKFLEIVNIEEKEAIKGCFFILLFALSIIAACVFIAGWVALVIYIIIPLDINNAGLEALRFSLSFIGIIAIAIATAYIMMLNKVLNG